MNDENDGEALVASKENIHPELLVVGQFYS